MRICKKIYIRENRQQLLKFPRNGSDGIVKENLNLNSYLRL